MTTSGDPTFGGGGGGRDCGADAAAYVLGALEDREAELFRHHMADCVVCRDEVATLQAVADALPLAAPPVGVPRDLKRSVMTAVRAEPRGAPARSRQRDWRSSLTRPAWARPALAGGAVLAAACLAFVGIEIAGSGSTSPRVVQASVAGPAQSAAAFVRLQDGRGELVLARMPAAPSGRIYEVWLKRDGHAVRPTSALFNVTSAGTAAVDVPGNLRNVDQVLVTAEPLGGSSVPTSTPVIVARLTS
jgi:anti-sigma-K factor RskA